MKRYKTVVFEKYTPLLEKDNRKIIDRIFNFPEDVTNSLHEMSSKHSLVLANYVKSVVIDSLSRSSDRDDKNVVAKLKKNQQLSPLESEHYQWYVSNYFPTIANNLRYIRDWINGRNERPNPDESLRGKLQDLSFRDAYTKAQDWHEYLEKGGGGAVSTGNIIQTFKDGFYWVDLETNKCEIEGEHAGHCGTGEFGKNSNLFSLRNPHHNIVLTADINKKTGAVRQIRGNANTKPKEQYHGYIVAFLTNKELNKKYKGLFPDFKKAWNSQRNFSIKDLSDNMYNTLVQKGGKQWELSAKGTDIESQLSDLGVDEVYWEAIIWFADYRRTAVEDTDGYSTNIINFDDGTTYSFYIEEEAERYLEDRLREDFNEYSIEDYFFDSYLDEDALADVLIDNFRNSDYEYGYDNPEDVLLGEKPADADGEEWSDEQRDRAGEEYVKQQEDYYRRDPKQVIEDMGMSIKDFVNGNIDRYYDIEGYIQDNIGEYEHISYYDGSWDEHDGIIIIREN